MKKLYTIADIANKILMTVTIFIAMILFAYSMYVLSDTFYLKKSAFVSYDLLKYKPAVSAVAGELENNGFEELLKINPDTVGWVEIFDTNINYPVVQGDDDLEYAGKDIYGKSSLTGAIYLASENSGDFNEWYNLIYGHHMDNGAMFGDIHKYRNENFFLAHRDGRIQTLNGDYDLKIFACVVTDSYEGLIYSVASKDRSVYPELMNYIKEHSIYYDDAYDRAETDETTKIVALSTCEDANTNGRIVLFADATPSDGSAIAASNSAISSPTIYEVVGHMSNNNEWALLNLLCVLITFGILVPIFFIRRKYRQMPYSKHKSKELKEKIDGLIWNEEEMEKVKEIVEDLKKFTRNMNIGLILEIILLIVAVIIFLKTENITAPMVIRDKWTGLMIFITADALMADFIFFRYRGKRPEQYS